VTAAALPASPTLHPPRLLRPHGVACCGVNARREPTGTYTTVICPSSSTRMTFDLRISPESGAVTHVTPHRYRAIIERKTRDRTEQTGYAVRRPRSQRHNPYRQAGPKATAGLHRHLRSQARPELSHEAGCVPSIVSATTGRAAATRSARSYQQAPASPRARPVVEMKGPRNQPIDGAGQDNSSHPLAADSRDSHNATAAAKGVPLPSLRGQASLYETAASCGHVGSSHVVGARRILPPPTLGETSRAHVHPSSGATTPTDGARLKARRAPLWRTRPVIRQTQPVTPAVPGHLPHLASSPRSATRGRGTSYPMHPVTPMSRCAAGGAR
jgi:hypothetical protein